MTRDVYFREGIWDIARGIRRVMIKANRSDDYREAAEDFYAALSDAIGIGVIDELGDLRDIGRLGLGDGARTGSVHRLQSGRDADVRVEYIS